MHCVLFADAEAVPLTDDMLVAAAQEIVNTSSSWMLLGAEIGLTKAVLDGIDVNSRARSEHQQHAAYEMLCQARERNYISTTTELIRACQNRENIKLACALSHLFRSKR